MQKPATTPSMPADDRPGVTYEEARAILARKGLNRSIRTLERWVACGILSIKRVTQRTVLLFRDEVEALVEPEEPQEQRLLSARLGRRGSK